MIRPTGFRLSPSRDFRYSTTSSVSMLVSLVCTLLLGCECSYSMGSTFCSPARGLRARGFRAGGLRVVQAGGVRVVQAGGLRVVEAGGVRNLLPLSLRSFSFLISFFFSSLLSWACLVCWWGRILPRLSRASRLVLKLNLNCGVGGSSAISFCLGMNGTKHWGVRWISQHIMESSMLDIRRYISKLFWLLASHSILHP